ncbi:hypothetical protein ABI_33500 [Asticcacaulis biprosthecium C19]|uniref:Uncharacterized protein n=1 Tax=Asticcacaulis biprosthecium C19 TaxID=715226 RepID=F4QQ46_9CAUL|nr:hypothetical protein ABI_33500 [Asticcacaulis biprosthecium C19]
MRHTPAIPKIPQKALYRSLTAICQSKSRTFWQHSRVCAALHTCARRNDRFWQQGAKRHGVTKRTK